MYRLLPASVLFLSLAGFSWAQIGPGPTPGGGGGTGSGSNIYCSPAGASGSAYTCSGTQGGSTAPSALTGLSLLFSPDVANTGAFTIKVGSLAAVTALTSAGATPPASYVTNPNFYIASYNGTNFIVTPAAGPTGTSGQLGTVTSASVSRSIVAADCGNTLTASASLTYTFPGNIAAPCQLAIVASLTPSQTITTAVSGATIDGATTSLPTYGACAGTPVTCPSQIFTMTAAGNWRTNGGLPGLTGAGANSSVPGTSHTFLAPSDIYICSAGCTITVPAPVQGVLYCVVNGDNVSTAITLSAIGSSARYESTARTSFGTAGTGTFVSSGAVADAACIYGQDSTHYLTLSHVGSWTAN